MADYGLVVGLFLFLFIFKLILEVFELLGGKKRFKKIKYIIGK